MKHPFSFNIEVEQTRHLIACEKLLERSFGLGRHQRLVTKMRRAIIPIASLSFISIETQSKNLAGLLRFYHLRLGVKRLKHYCFFGPLAIDPIYQNSGLGHILTHHGIQQASALGFKGVFIIGNSSYYKKFGFSDALVKHLNLPGSIEPLILMGLELTPNAFKHLSGTIIFD
ncbi:MAG: N-acetyltransferase [Pseudomonadota bacterium]